MGRSTKVAGMAATIASLCLICACAGCDTNEPTPTSDDMVEAAIAESGVEATDVAAVVAGEVITWDQVDESIKIQRARLSLTEDADWEAYLGNSGMTQADYEAYALKELVDDSLERVAAQRLGIDVSADAAARLSSLEGLYPSHKAFVSALEKKGFTVEEYSFAIGHNMLVDALCDQVVSSVDPSSEQVRQYAVVVAPTLVGKRSSHILFSSDDYATAVDVLARVEAGEDFDELADAYSIDESAAQGGDMGWDSLNTFVPEYQSVLDGLDEGEVSGIVRTSFGYHIIKCTEVYTAPLDADGDLDISAIPDSLMDAIVTSMDSVLRTQMFNDYLEGLEADEPIAVFDREGNQVSNESIGLAVEEKAEPSTFEDTLEAAREAVRDSVSGSLPGAESLVVDDLAPRPGVDPTAVIEQSAGAAR